MSTDLSARPATMPSASAPRPSAARRPRRVGPAVKWVFLVLGLVVTLVPFVWMLSVSFRTQADLFQHPANLLPREWTLHGYTAIWQQLPFLRLVVNTFVFAGAATLLCLVFDSLTAYALARMDFPGRNLCFWLVLATLMVPFQVTLIPVFIELFHLGWLDTYQGLVIPRATSAFGIFLLRQFFLSIPRELDEAARIDGANHLRIYWNVILPNAKPALATVAVINFMNLWNDLLWPLVVTSSPNMRTLPAALTLFGGNHVTDYAVLMAGAVISLLPLAAAFFLAQRYFVAGVATTGLK
jgi:multiple sugar transport system permease protein